ncbi:hypothetical protein V8C86DRAFT_1305393 [Haematococcus lacustris]
MPSKDDAALLIELFGPSLALPLPQPAKAERVQFTFSSCNDDNDLFRQLFGTAPPPPKPKPRLKAAPKSEERGSGAAVSVSGVKSVEAGGQRGTQPSTGVASGTPSLTSLLDGLPSDSQAKAGKGGEEEEEEEEEDGFEVTLDELDTGIPPPPATTTATAPPPSLPGAMASSKAAAAAAGGAGGVGPGSRASRMLAAGSGQLAAVAIPGPPGTAAGGHWGRSAYVNANTGLPTFIPSDAEAVFPSQATGSQYIKLPRQTRVTPEEYREFISLGHGEIFNLNLDRVLEAPWRLPTANLRDYFNYDLDERKWREYCRKVEQYRAEFTLRNQIRTVGAAEPPAAGPGAGGERSAHEGLCSTCQCGAPGSGPAHPRGG